jgi:hypothetical protein
MTVSLIPFISPFIDLEKFPIEFKILDMWFYKEKNSITSMHRPMFRLSHSFFEEINKCKALNKFKKQYKTALSLMHIDNKMSDILKKLETRNYYDTIALPKCFPFNKSYDKEIFGQIRDYDRSYLRLNFSVYKSNIPIFEDEFHPKILGDFQLVRQAFMLWENFKHILVSNLMHLELPTVPFSELNKCLDNYSDIKYRYITVINMSLPSFGDEIYTRLVEINSLDSCSKNISNTFNILLYPYDSEDYITTKWFMLTDKIGTKNITEFCDKELVIGKLGIFSSNYLLIYSNIRPNLIFHVLDLLNAAKFIAYSVITLEVEKKLI